MKKEKTVNLAARALAQKRWKDTTPEERSETLRRAAQVPRTAKRCFCGEHSMWRAANRYFDCCRKAGVIVLNRPLREDEKKSA